MVFGWSHRSCCRSLSSRSRNEQGGQGLAGKQMVPALEGFVSPFTCQFTGFLEKKVGK